MKKCSLILKRGSERGYPVISNQLISWPILELIFWPILSNHLDFMISIISNQLKLSSNLSESVKILGDSQ